MLMRKIRDSKEDLKDLVLPQWGWVALSKFEGGEGLLGVAGPYPGPWSVATMRQGENFTLLQSKGWLQQGKGWKTSPHWQHWNLEKLSGARKRRRKLTYTQDPALMQSRGLQRLGVDRKITLVQDLPSQSRVWMQHGGIGVSGMLRRQTSEKQTF